MLTLISGAYSDLEISFLEHVRQLKSNPWSRLAIVAPSARLRDHLQRLLAQNHGASLNIFFHTFSSLARDVVNTASPLKKPLLSDSLFFDTLVKQIIKNDRPFQDLQDMAIPEGFPPTVRATLRDLMDAGVPRNGGEQFKEALEENLFQPDLGVGQLMDLFRLYKIYCERLDELPVYPASFLIRQAIQLTPTSSYLKSFDEVLYYGFYDLTGNQADFFQAVSKAHSTTLYFPFIKNNPVYTFAGRFRDNFIQPVMSEEQVLALQETPRPQPHVISVSGTSDEAWFVAQEILRIHQEKKIPFDRMAVLARHKERLVEHLPHLFQERDIPFQSSVRLTLAQHPRIAEAMEHLKNSEWNLDRKLRSWREWSQKTEEVLNLVFSSWDEASLTDVLIKAVRGFAWFDEALSKISFGEYIETLKERWMSLPHLAQKESARGVHLCHAEASRGLSFEVVFLLGLEPKVFPRMVREDPFLRDEARFSLSSMLGYKISQKNLALEEEKLLFHLMTSSARGELYLTYQRTDHQGQVVGMSPYLRSWAAERQVDLETETQVLPRPYSVKLKQFSPAYFSRRDMSLRMILNSAEEFSVQLASALKGPAASLERGLRQRQALQEFFNPGEFDGLLDQALWKPYLNHLVLSPTALETLAQCPFQYFSKQVLRLSPLEEDSHPDTLDPRTKGELIHRFFEEYLKALPQEMSQSRLMALFEDIFSDEQAKKIPVHPVLWESLKKEIKKQIQQTLEQDLAWSQAHGVIPTYFEHELKEALPSPLDQMKWGGRADRIDVGDDWVRVVDYKSGRADTRDIVKALLSGKKAQPVIYLLLAEEYFKRQQKPKTKFSFSYLYLRDENPHLELSADDWAEHKAGAIKTISAQCDRIQKGQFPIQVGSWCDFCDYSPLCRRDDSISVYRASQLSPQEKSE